MSNMKKVVAICLFASVLGSTLTGFASWKKLGYDTSDAAIANDSFIITEYEVDDATGLPTNQVRENGYASEVKWVLDGYEAAFPHYGIERLYLDNEAQDRTRLSVAPNWDMEYRPEFWEAKAPYREINALYSKINNQVWQKQPNAPLTPYLYLSTNADVKKYYDYFGFAGYEVLNNAPVQSAYFKDFNSNVIDYAKTSDAPGTYFDRYGKDKTEDYVAFDVAKELTQLTPNVLTAREQFVNLVGAYLEIPKNYGTPFGEYDAVLNISIDENFRAVNTCEGAEIIEVDSTMLNGPDYKTGDRHLVNVVDELLSGQPSTFFDEDVFVSNRKEATVDWVKGGFELAAPYRYYDYLVINGVVMNGDVIETWMPGIYTKLPTIYKYAGYSNPTITYKVAWPELAYPHNIYEEKFVNGISTGEYRPTGESAKRLPTFTVKDSNKVLVVDLVSPLHSDKPLVGELNIPYTVFATDVAGNPVAMMNTVLDALLNPVVSDSTSPAPNTKINDYLKELGL